MQSCTQNALFDVVLVACCGNKLQGSHPAKDLYQSQLFLKSRQWAERHGKRWAILSALHGVVNPEKVIEPYDCTLNSMPVQERRRWDARVLEDLQELGLCRVAVLAGKNYCGWTGDANFEVVRPMQGLGIGQQLAWLTEANSRQVELFPSVS